jgi:hypothetical protein
VIVIDWHSELATILQRIAEIEARISLQRQKTEQGSADANSAAVTPLLTILQERLNHAMNHKRFIESRIAARSIQTSTSERSKDAGPGTAAGSSEAHGDAALRPSKEVQIKNIIVQLE